VEILSYEIFSCLYLYYWKDLLLEFVP
jgi:hypothetical protein